MMKNEMNQIQNQIISKFNQDYKDFLWYFENEKNPDILEFVKKYLDWYINRPMMRYRMFGQVIYQDDNYIWSSLNSFIGNYFKDDSYFTIQWMMCGEYNEEEDKFDDIRTDDKEDMFAYPVLIPDDDCGTQNIRQVISAMEQYERNEDNYMSHYFDA